MSRSFLRSPVVLIPLVLGLFAASASAQSGFDVVSISVPPNSVWQINRPIEIEFTNIVDFTSVNSNTVQIRKADGTPASGTYYSIEPKKIGFQPDCPRLTDASDAGLLPGGVAYRIFLPGTGTGSPTVLSQSGRELVQPHLVHFTTPTSTLPSVLFFDAREGAPRPLIRTSPTQVDASFIRLGLDPANRVYFRPLTPPDPTLGAQMPAGFRAPLNLYSTIETRVEIEIHLNQPIDGTPSNLGPGFVDLEYLDAASVWRPLVREVVLVENCTQSGAIIRVVPIGILPQWKTVRVVLGSSFADIAGNTRPNPLVVGSFFVSAATDPGTSAPGDGGDEFLEEFRFGGVGPGSHEDTEAFRRNPGAAWGGGSLSASFAGFGGTGGPGGNFDWKIGNDLPLSQSNHPIVVLDTTFSIIQNDSQTVQQTVINGIVDVRNLTVTASGTLKIVGPNPCKILVSGLARIDGEINIEGNDNGGVATINTTSIPEPGAAGQGGGGRGGTGSPLTMQSSPRGGTGFGAFGATDAGGGGGESGFRATWPSDSFDGNRRPGGGGGGRFGPDFLRPMNVVPGYLNPNECPDQGVIGLDAERGFKGSPLATGAVTGAVPPQGGAAGPRPFSDGNAGNDYWGTMRLATGGLIAGELPQPWAGAGGGGGGNAIVSNSFPTTPFDPNGDEKGAGGGGAGGSITILALDDIRFGPRGRINASGGTGGGGENSTGGGITRIGGGSGGGSGGHIVLQTARLIDMSAFVTTTGVNMPAGGLYALGGQGGAGRDDLGGAHANGMQSPPQFDALPPNSYPHITAPCGVISGQAGYTFNNLVGNSDPATVVACAGGDGGPGLIQLHAPTLSDVLIPSTPTENIYKAIKPPPVGSTPGLGVPNFSVINSPLSWDHLIPIFARKSEAVSKWITLGAASVDLALPSPDDVRFLFGGTGTNGEVLTTGSGPGATVADLPPIFTGSLSSAPTPPYVAADLRTIVLDGTALPDDLYLRTPALLRRFSLELTQGGTTEFEVGSASYDPTTHELRLTVSAGGMPLAGYGPGDGLVLRPRFFRVATDGVVDSLPASAKIRIEFQATTQNQLGGPDSFGESPWTKDLPSLDPNVAGNPDYRFVRFKVFFDIGADGSPLTPFTPVPSLDFLRIPFRF